MTMPDTEYFEGDRWPVEDDLRRRRARDRDARARPEPEVFLAQARRVLRADRRIVLTVPFAARWHYVPHDYWRFTPSSLRNLLEARASATSSSTPAATS